jgi:serine/threonine-protein kinase
VGHTLVRKEGGGVALAGAVQSDPTARTMMVGQGQQAPVAGHSAARYARPTIVLATIGLVLWLVGGLVDAVGGLIRTFHDGERLSNIELVLVLVGVIAAAITPIALGVSRISKVWQNSVKTLELATDLRRTVVVGLATYGAAALTLHIVLNVGVRDSARLVNGLWDVALFGGSVLFAAVAGGVGPIARAIRRGK